MTHQALAPPSAANPAQNYESYFVPAIGLPIAHHLLGVAALRPGERVLDVGCGTGVVTRLAAEAVGAGGVVAGADPHPGMLAVARAVVRPKSGVSVEWHEGRAEALPLPDGGFDVVLCQMAMQFVPDRGQALKEMRRVLVDGGRVALNAPGPAGPLFEALDDAMSKHIGNEAAGFVRAVFSLHDETELDALLTAAEFREVRTSATTHDLMLPGPSDFLRQYIWSTPLAGVVSAASEEARSALEREMVAEWERFREGDGMRYRQRVVTATGRR